MILCVFVRGNVARRIAGGRGLLDDLVQHPLKLRAFETDRRGLHGERLRAKGLGLEAVALQLVGQSPQKQSFCAGFSSTSRGISSLWRWIFSTALSRKIFSNKTRSWATCWSMIQRPSGPVARINDSRNWPRGFKPASWFKRFGLLAGLDFSGSGGSFGRVTS